MSRESDRSTLYVLCDRLLDGRLADKLLLWRDAGVSLRATQALLEGELGVKIALETIRRWLAYADRVNGEAA